ncbi:uncharacterized protein LOC117115972 [Anneissia japonica]|uniref:uncharacterized protein LOC117115972 n=1 Tax=Anneissia japonica TaxID=1529436 RepID=UPI00142595B1|nr:uncharacterized protein LOC117115972 [Anneissia japonica]XP_033115765.1 uncharacterized protein LOC117115972 [Anneissia japonica]
MSLGLVEEKRINFANVLKKACKDARNGTVMIVPKFNNFTDAVGLLREFNVDDNQDNTFPFIESNSPSKMLSPTSQGSTTCTESNSINDMDILSEREYEELCSNKWLNSIGKEILCKQNIMDEDQDFLGIIGELNVVEKRYTGDLSMFYESEGKQNTIPCYPETFTEQGFQDLSVYFVQDTARGTIQQEQHMDARFQPYAKWKHQSPEELERKEKNRLRSKAYRLRKKLQLETLRREEEGAKIAEEVANKEREVADRKHELSAGCQSEVNQHT